MKAMLAVAALSLLSVFAWAQNKTSGGPVGRYVITPGLHDGPIGALLLDTSSGRAWFLKGSSIDIPGLGAQTLLHWEAISEPPR